MRTSYWIVLVLVAFCASSMAFAQGCRVTGVQQMRTTSVMSPGVGTFEVRVWGSELRAELRGSIAHFQTVGLLSFSSERSVGEVQLGVSEPTVIGGMLFVQDRDGVNIRGVSGDSDRLLAEFQMGAVTFSASIPCSVLSLTGPRERTAYRRGFAQRARRSEACPTDETEVLDRAWRNGQRDGRAIPQLAPVSVPSRLWRARGSSLQLHRRPSLRAEHFRLEADESVEWGEVGRRGTWIKLQRGGTHSILAGWVHRADVEVVPVGNRWRRGRGGFRGRAARIPRIRRGSHLAVIRQGTRVYAAPEASEPWAVASESKSVFVVFRGRWAQIRDSAFLRTSGHAWVRAENVQLDRFVGHGLSAMLTRSGGAVVTGVEPASPAGRVGLRAGDEIRQFLAGTFSMYRITPLPRQLTVLRAREFVELTNPCLPLGSSL